MPRKKNLQNTNSENTEIGSAEIESAETQTREGVDQFGKTSNQSNTQVAVQRLGQGTVQTVSQDYSQSYIQNSGQRLGQYSDQNSGQIQSAGMEDAAKYLINLWLGTKSGKTKINYGIDIIQFQKHAQKTLLGIKMEDIQNYITHLQTNYKPKSVARKVASLKSFYTFTTQLGYTKIDIAKPIKIPKTKNELAQRILSQSEVQAILQASFGRDRLIIKTMYYLGLRAEEICNLKWQDITQVDHWYFLSQFIQNKIREKLASYQQNPELYEKQNHISQNFYNSVAYKPNPVFSVFGKGGKTRFVVCPAEIYLEIVDYLAGEFCFILEQKLYKTIKKTYPNYLKNYSEYISFGIDSELDLHTFTIEFAKRSLSNFLNINFQASNFHNGGFQNSGFQNSDFGSNPQVQNPQHSFSTSQNIAESDSYNGTKVNPFNSPQTQTNINFVNSLPFEIPNMAELLGKNLSQKYLFGKINTTKNTALDTTTLFKIVRKSAQKAGIWKNVSPHWFRHSHASHSLEKGAPLTLIQQSLGHSSLAITGQYLHIKPTDGSSMYL